LCRASDNEQVLRPAVIAFIGLTLSATALAIAIAPALSATRQRPTKPTVYVVAPARQCEKIAVRTVDGERVTRLAPPAPGIRAVAIAPRRIRVSWVFAASPSACRPAFITLGIAPYGAARATPRIAHKRVSALKGAVTLNYPSFLPQPDVAWGSAISEPRHYSSKPQLVLIRR
jgi:hypothetical protein